MSYSTPIRLVIADDHLLFREAVRQVLSMDPGIAVVGEASDGEEATERCTRIQPHVLLLDVSMPRLSGIEALARLRETAPGTAVVLLTAGLERSDLFEALVLGIRGVILKSAESEELIQCVRTVASGGYWFEQETVGNLVATLRSSDRALTATRTEAPALTRRERQIVSAVVQGASNAEIGREFSMSGQTVKNHLTRIFDKTGMSTRVELAIYGLSRGMDALCPDETPGAGGVRPAAGERAATHREAPLAARHSPAAVATR